MYLVGGHSNYSFIDNFDVNNEFNTVGKQLRLILLLFPESLPKAEINRENLNI